MGFDVGMTVQDQEERRITLENAVKNESLDFTAKYMAVCDLHSLVQTNLEIVTPETISALEWVLEDPTHSSERQCLFLYREAANALCHIILHTIEPFVKQAISGLKDVLRTTVGYPQRAATEALGSLPVSIHGPEIREEKIEDIPFVQWSDLLREKDIGGVRPDKESGPTCQARRAGGVYPKQGLTPAQPSPDPCPVFIGRSLVFAVDRENRLLVVKLARPEDAPDSIYREAVWMEYLRSRGYSFPLRFDIPLALKIAGSHVFSLEDVPVTVPKGANLHPKRYAIAFIADKDYFTYPNDHRTGTGLAVEEFEEVMFRDAWLLGSLTSSGIVHSAPIELFHNRVQRHRRQDNGLYEWPRAGRLDRWLISCRYPNFGLTGVRDFEHLISLNGHSEGLYHYIGIHILSLLLVAGSYFRNKDKGKVGFDEHGGPVDARDLFDRKFLREVVEGIFLSYYNGFVGMEFTGEVPFSLDSLISRMIEEMGIDRYMEEILRVEDQNEMTDEEFRDFLKEKGYSDRELECFEKGIEDIVVYTGPHLGGFNERISLPELIESVGSMSAACIVGRYWKERCLRVKV